MIRKVSSRIYSHYEVVVAIFLAVFIAMTVVITTGLGMGNVSSRTVPVSDSALGSNISVARDVFQKVQGNASPTSALVEGIPLGTEAEFTKAANAFKPLRKKLEETGKLKTRESLLDPFSLAEGAPAGQANPLIAKNGTSFIIMALPKQADNNFDSSERLLKAFKDLKTGILQEYPQAHVYLNSPLYAAEQSRQNSTRISIIIMLVTLLSSLLAFYISTAKSASAFAAASSILVSQISALFILWLATFVVTVPSSLLPVLTLTAAIFSAVSSAVFNAIDAHSLTYTEEGNELNAAGPRARKRARIEYLAQRVSQMRNLIVTAFVVTVLAVALMFASGLSHSMILALICLPTLLAVWGIELIFVPCLLLIAETFTASNFGKESKQWISQHSPLISLQSKLHRRLSLPYLETPFTNNKAAPAIAGLILLLSTLPLLALSPHAASSAELSNSKETIYFRQMAHEGFPSLVDPDFTVIAETSPTNLGDWAIKVANTTKLVTPISEAAPLGEKYAVISLDFKNKNPRFAEKQAALKAVQQSAAGFKHFVYSETARNIETTGAAVKTAPFALLISVLVAFLALFLLSGNLLWSGIELLVGFFTVAGAIGITSGLFKLGILKVLPGSSIETRVDTGGIFIGGFLAVLITAVTLLEPLYNKRPTLTRTTWLITGITAAAACLTGFIQMITVGLIVLSSILLGIMNSVLVYPQILHLQEMESSKLAAKHPKILSLHQKIYHTLTQKLKRSDNTLAEHKTEKE
ncbi:hypothetical protein KRX54_04410 [Actinomycetaceae bacterium TAE3-ERU4]|nr:hypothetical protein [Actinomycetaceae bacterium TAE3-ERU4]